MWEEYHAMRAADPSFEPARPVIPAFSRQPYDIPGPMPVITDPRAVHIAELAGIAYEMVLQLILRYFTHTDETDEQLGVLIDAAIDTMAGVLRPLAVTLTTLPVGPEHAGATVGFTFQMYYVMSNLVPWREPAWALLHERMSLLTERCALAGPELDAVRVKAAEITAKLKAHVPAALIP